jgi:hypothetical protein
MGLRFSALASVCVLLVTAAASAEDMLRAQDLTDNVRVRLVSATLSETRGHNLIATFQTEEKEPQTHHVGFPAHSFTPHEQTLRAVIQCCCFHPDKHSLGKATVEAVFSIPPPSDRQKLGQAGYLQRCYLVSIDLANDP